MCTGLERNEQGQILTNCEECNDYYILELDDDELVEYNKFLNQENTWEICPECSKNHDVIKMDSLYITDQPLFKETGDDIRASAGKIKKVIEGVISRVKKSIKEDEANGGPRRIKSSSSLDDNLKFFLLGAEANSNKMIIIPREWHQHFKDEDPEYKEFLRLKEKFNE